MVLEHYNLRTAPFACIPPRDSWPTDPDFSPLRFVQQSPHSAGLKSYPLFVKPATVSTGIGISQKNKVNDEGQLLEMVTKLSTQFPAQTLLVEKFLCGREFTVGLVGTGSGARVLGVRELIFLKDKPLSFPIDTSLPYESLDKKFYNVDVYGHELKHQWTPNPQQVSIDLEDKMAKEISDMALRAWRILGCRDGGRIDVRCDGEGRPNFIEVSPSDKAFLECVDISIFEQVNPIPGLAPGWSDLPRLAEGYGMSFEDLIRAIVESALQRIKAMK